jgi:6,7-dimethyl-8-ribityllumazine synthase
VGFAFSSAKPYGIAEITMTQPRRAGAQGREDAALEGARIVVVEGRFYDDIADMLLAGAKRAFAKAHVDFDLITVPGALEIPQAIAIAIDAAHARHKPYDGAVALGCVVRGETSHYDIVAGESARALMDLAIAHRIPVGNGILTVDTEAQAVARAKPEEGDKGGWAVDAALTLVRLRRRFSSPKGRR